ncbi:hypothetical protein [Tuberibacillus sp. Marseille-P3662]|nr:hypothetical protein [Tuberibacillus sp. Marseille-P3662]
MKEPLFAIDHDTYQTLSSSERYLFDYINKHFESIADMSIVIRS